MTGGGWGLAQPWALLGLLGVSVPILLHLLARRPIAPVPVPSIRFHPTTLLPPRRRRRIEDVRLLALRTAALVLAVLALARPMPLPGGGTVPESVASGDARPSDAAAGATGRVSLRTLFPGQEIPQDPASLQVALEGAISFLEGAPPPRVLRILTEDPPEVRARMLIGEADPRFPAYELLARREAAGIALVWEPPPTLAPGPGEDVPRAEVPHGGREGATEAWLARGAGPRVAETLVRAGVPGIPANRPVRLEATAAAAGVGAPGVGGSNRGLEPWMADLRIRLARAGAEPVEAWAAGDTLVLGWTAEPERLEAAVLLHQMALALDWEARRWGPLEASARSPEEGRGIDPMEDPDGRATTGMRPDAEVAGPAAAGTTRGGEDRTPLPRLLWAGVLLLLVAEGWMRRGRPA